MKRLTITIFVFVVMNSQFPLAQAQTVPSSARSREAIARVSPRLTKEVLDKGFNWGAPIYIRIFKKTKQLEVWLKKEESYRLFKTYEICTYGWAGRLGPKVQQGDGQAPEGFYFVTPKQMNPLSSYHLSFNLGYPNAYDRAHKRTGGALMVHGRCVSIGCYAMTDKRIEEIYALADGAFRNGQPFFRVHIFPFPMNDDNLQKYRHSKWIDFWRNLKEGHDFFESSGYKPPNVLVKNKRYVFEPS